jgi:[acyl-carrier-protein] S-malonyltransferase
MVGRAAVFLADQIVRRPDRRVTMTSTAFLFPGQGSQRVGMGRDLRDRHPGIVAPIFDTADEILGFKLSRLCWEGPEDELRRTDITQPAIFVASLAAYRVLAAAIPAPSVVAGHSLGEYTALVAAGVLEWTDALALVRRRGILMAGVNATTPGAMAAVMGLPPELVEQLCGAARGASGEVVEVANYNDATQTVVSGTVAGIDAFTQLVKASDFPELVKAGDFPESKIIRLGVGAPFHCSLMSAVEEEFAHDLAAVSFSDPHIPVVANVTARTISTGAEARAALGRQLAGSVRWSESLSAIAGLGVDAFVEVGPGRVLTGFCKRAYPDVASYSASDARRIDKITSELQPASSV